VRRQRAGEPALHDEGAGARVGQQERESLGGELGIEGYVRGFRLHDAHQRDGPLDRARHQHGHRRVRARAESAQPMGETIREGVELGIGEPLPAAHDRRCLRRAGDLRGEQGRDRGRARQRRRGVVPFDELALPLGRRQQRQSGNAPGRIGEDAAQQGQEVTGHALDRRRIEQVGRVLDPEHSVDLAR
jgi:hypothetical protein